MKATWHGAVIAEGVRGRRVQGHDPSRVATARPIPDAAPVTMTTLP